MSLISKFFSVGSATMVSRILGFGREALMAAALGAGPIADAFYAAFRFPNLFRRLFAEGAFNAAFVPLFAKEIEEGGLEGARKFSSEVLGVLFSILMILTIIIELSMPFVVKTIIAPGFVNDPDKFNNTVTMSLIMFPYLMFMSLTAMMSGILNSLHQYFIAAIAPVFLNVVLIGVLGFALLYGLDPLTTGINLSWGVMAAGILQLLIVAVAVRKAGVHIKFKRPKLTPNVKRLLYLAAPAAVTGGITQINLVIGQIIASSKEGAISVLQYADRLYQLPLGVVGIAVGVVLLPELARALKGKKLELAGALQNRSVEFALFMTLPAAAALVVISDELVRVVFERGAFTALTTDKVAGALAIFGLGLPAFVLIKAFMPGFFAREDTKTPMRFAMVSVVINIALALLLFPRIGERGIATAEICSGWANALLLLFTLVKRGYWHHDLEFTKRILKLFLAAGLMGVFMYYLADYLAPHFKPETSALVQAVTLLVMIFAGAIVYFALTYFLKATDWSMIMRGLKRQKPKPE